MLNKVELGQICSLSSLRSPVFRTHLCLNTVIVWRQAGEASVGYRGAEDKRVLLYVF